MGALAVRMLADMIAGRPPAESHVKYRCELIRRGSVAPLK
jgi:LacI family transcriptional regulator